MSARAIKKHLSVLFITASKQRRSYVYQVPRAM